MAKETAWIGSTSGAATVLLAVPHRSPRHVGRAAADTSPTPIPAVEGSAARDSGNENGEHYHGDHDPTSPDETDCEYHGHRPSAQSKPELPSAGDVGCAAQSLNCPDGYMTLWA